MIKTNLPIYLASKSPRRRKLLKQINLNFKSFTVDMEEKIKPGEKPSVSVKRLSKEKLEIARQKVIHGIIITADTIVVLKGKVIGKPKDKNEAKRFLKNLSGKVHTVYTGFSIYNSENKMLLTDFEKTSVEFRKLTSKEIDDYIKSGSPMDKAGAYGIQDDFGAVFIKKINGCYYNVVGLPLTKVYQTLKKII
ncbi:MAG: septum formation protein Maf [Ignavibacteriae bacterium]|nr:MAG: septum formation protein Maf [Ignavibacteriota bacterium]